MAEKPDADSAVEKWRKSKAELQRKLLETTSDDHKAQLQDEIRKIEEKIPAAVSDVEQLKVALEKARKDKAESDAAAMRRRREGGTKFGQKEAEILSQILKNVDPSKLAESGIDPEKLAALASGTTVLTVEEIQKALSQISEMANFAENLEENLKSM